MSFPRYPRYKPSGVEWLGDVPAHWGVIPLSRITRSRCDGPFGSGLKSEHYSDEGARVIRLQNIRAGQFYDADVAFIPLDYFEGELSGHDVIAGDVLIAGLGDDNNSVGRACIAPSGLGPALVKADCFRFRLDQHVASPSFIALQLSAGAEPEAGRLATGTTRSRIPLSAMASRRIALPPASEQTAIAAFLDRETAKIDALVAEQEKLIALLKEKRQAVISHAVTKGLNPDAPMKPSGIEWLGDVPAHWEMTTIRRIAKRLDTGCTPSTVDSSDELPDGLPWYTPGDFASGLVLGGSARSVPRGAIEAGDSKLFSAGCVLIVSIGATLGRVGYTERECSANQQINAIHPADRVVGCFLAHSLSVKAEVMRFLSNASTIGIMNQEKTKDVPLAVPPTDEQREICAFVDRQSGELELLIAEAERAITLLKERRSALISAAVTGQIDVRGLAEGLSA